MIGYLTREEEKIIKQFKKQLIQEYPGQIVSVIVYGSKARGDHQPESDIDVLVIVKNDDWKFFNVIRKIGYELDEKIDYKLSIQVMTQQKFEYLQENGFQFIQNVLRDAVKA